MFHAIKNRLVVILLLLNFTTFQRVYDYFAGMTLKRTKFGPQKTGMGTGVGGRDGQDKVERVKAHFLAHPNETCRGAAPKLGVCVYDSTEMG